MLSIKTTRKLRHIHIVQHIHINNIALLCVKRLQIRDEFTLFQPFDVYVGGYGLDASLESLSFQVLQELEEPLTP